MSTTIKRRFRLSTAHWIMLSFLAMILLGSLLLALPISSANGVSVGYIDALFTATTATCVTGLVTLPTFSTWSIFGQAVILLLIQVGGLGVITVLSGLMIALHRRMSLGNRLLIQDAFNLNTLSGLGAFIKKVLLGTLLIEGIGALCYMIVFIPEFGAKGIWISVFTSISAFCNAGIDVIAPDSLCGYVHNPLVNAVTCVLIILGGIGYIVWWDVLRVLKDAPRKSFRCLRHLTLHSKLAITTTLVLIFGGALSIFIFEYDNPLTMKGFTLAQKIGASLFQSVTTRTAGFMTLPQQNLSNASAVLCLLLMFIGGSPVGTAGGIKTVTALVLLACAVSTIRGKNDVTLFHRNVSRQALRKALAVSCMSFIILSISTLLLCAITHHASALDILYETVSATATVGLSRNLTPTLSTAGKLIITATMYLGRVGPISLAIAFNTKKESPNIIKNPTEEISVG